MYFHAFAASSQMACFCVFRWSSLWVGFVRHCPRQDNCQRVWLSPTRLNLVLCLAAILPKQRATKSCTCAFHDPIQLWSVMAVCFHIRAVMIMLACASTCLGALHLDAAKCHSYRSRLCFRFRVHTCLPNWFKPVYSFWRCPSVSYICLFCPMWYHFNSLHRMVLYTWPPYSACHRCTFHLD